MKKTLLFIQLILMTTLLFGKIVTPEEAGKVTRNFIQEKAEKYNIKAFDYKLTEVKYDENEQPYLYRFDVNDLGFVMVSASDLVPPILAYSFTNNYEENPAVRDLLYSYRDQISVMEKEQSARREKITKQWNYYLTDSFIAHQDKEESGVDPLLTTSWNQNKYYNTYCPWDVNSGSYYDYRVPNGCVALAMSQIMNYYRHPIQGTGGSSYIPQGYPRQTVMLSNHTYNWDAMCDVPNSYANEIAKLVYHFGVMIQMGYTPDGSGAQTDDARNKLAQNFGYYGDIQKENHGEYMGEYAYVFINLLQNELNEHRPIYYSGCYSNYSSCHAFVLDGYDDQDLFHVNWGWGGSSNGYFQIDNLNPGGGSFSYADEALINIYPAGSAYPRNCTVNQRNTASFGYITDGSTNQRPYQANPDCSWMVATPGATSYTFNFNRINTAPGDIVTIYNGPTVNEGIAGSFTGNTIPSSVTVQADSVLITFTSADTMTENTEYMGFLINYSTNIIPRTCESTTVLNYQTHEMISDGSLEGENYLPETNCTWNIRPSYVSGYTVAFPKFNLKYGDFVDIYNASTNPPTLWNRFDIYNLPNTIYNCNFSKMKVNFVADNWSEGDGFLLDYWAILNVESNNELEDLAIYPNPATDFVTLNFSNDNPQLISCKVIDITGKVVLTHNFNHQGGEHSETLNISNIASGFYIIHLDSENGKTIRKLTIQ